MAISSTSSSSPIESVLAQMRQARQMVKGGDAAQRSSTSAEVSAGGVPVPCKNR